MNCLKTTAIIFCVLAVVPKISAVEEECAENSANAVELILSTSRNRTGAWVTNFSLSKDDSDTSEVNNLTLNLSQNVTECGGKRKVHIRGIITGLAPSHPQGQIIEERDPLLFHTKCGTNVAVLNNGRTIRKINLEESANGLVFTNRPLKINEVLEVKLEKKHNKFSVCLAIGVTTLSPEGASLPELPHINSIKNTSWAWYNVNIYYNGNEHLKNYGKNTNTMEVDERVGVMRSNTGSLHFFANGVDQGPAVSNIPYPVYGVVELYGNAVQATIVHS